ncbi:MAG: anion permease [Sedimentisphaerales bacterium]|nr:anion permease [Sedimentisphaerales bacterium]
MPPVPPLFAGAFLGYNLGANDSANVFGAAVAARIIPFRTATTACALALTLGAVLQGLPGIQTLSSLTDHLSLAILTSISVCAGLTVAAMTFARLPVSTSQAVIGSIVGIALATGHAREDLPLLTKVATCWIATPLTAATCACLLYKALAFLFSRIAMSILTRDKILWSGLLVAGVYGSYALGANSVANATGILSGRLSGLSDSHLALIGAVAISLGTLTASKRVMFAVGSGITPLDAFTAFVAVASMSVSLHLFAWVGVPVSTSQAVVGAILGVGLMRGVYTLRWRKLRNIVLGWIFTPVIALTLSCAAYAILSGFSLTR